MDSSLVLLLPSTVDAIKCNKVKIYGFRAKIILDTEQHSLIIWTGQKSSLIFK